MKTMFDSRPMGRLIGLGLVLAGTFTGMAQNNVTFQIDMTSQPSATNVYVRGSFNNWGNPDVTVNGLLLTNNGSGVYTGTVAIADFPGTVEACKVFYQPGDNWEGDPNRQFVLAGGDQVLPLSAWNDKYPSPNNNVTFQVDMTARIFFGNFVPGGVGQTIRVSGDFNGWGDGQNLTNNPSLSGNASNIYSATAVVAGFPGGGASYKFRENSDWESPSSTGGNNRTLTLAGGDQVLPLVFYNDASLCDVITETNYVTFTVSMTNATTYDGSVVFNGSQPVILNAEFLGWWGGVGWTDPLVDRSQYTLTNIPSTQLYTITLPVPRGHALALTYKYGMDTGVNLDNEAGSGTNHVRYIRGNNYVMPLDTFGNQLVESSFGNLQAISTTPGNVSVTWLGRQCVTLQTSTNLANWTDHPETDGMNSTNWPVGTGSLFFRLVKP
jgi:hypothetical protein